MEKRYKETGVPYEQIDTTGNWILGVILFLVFIIGVAIYTSKADAQEATMTERLVVCENLEDAKSLADVVIDGSFEEIKAMSTKLRTEEKCLVLWITHIVEADSDILEYYRKDVDHFAGVLKVDLGFTAYAVVTGWVELEGETI